MPHRFLKTEVSEKDIFSTNIMMFLKYIYIFFFYDCLLSNIYCLSIKRCCILYNVLRQNRKFVNCYLHSNFPSIASTPQILSKFLQHKSILKYETITQGIPRFYSFKGNQLLVLFHGIFEIVTLLLIRIFSSLKVKFLYFIST